MSDGNTITEITRRAIIDEIVASGVSWSGRLPEDDFLSRMYDLASLPSTDRRFRSAASDIQQHRVNWADWPQDWVFYDTRFAILHGSDDNFLRFLAEMVHPVVRPNPGESQGLITEFNAHLKADGWSFIQSRVISGSPVFAAIRDGVRSAAFEEPTGWLKVDRQLEESRSQLMAALSEEQFQAVGLLCREALISVGQAVFDPSRHETRDGVIVSKTDASRMLEAFIASELQGGTNEEARAHGKAALKLALALQHRRNADFRMAALCVEATASVANLIAILAGRRG